MNIFPNENSQLLRINIAKLWKAAPRCLVSRINDMQDLNISADALNGLATALELEGISSAVATVAGS